MESTLSANVNSLISNLKSQRNQDDLEKLKMLVFSFQTLPPSNLPPNVKEFELTSK
jgi:hypothetical protein